MQTLGAILLSDWSFGLVGGILVLWLLSLLFKKPFPLKAAGVLALLILLLGGAYLLCATQRVVVKARQAANSGDYPSALALLDAGLGLPYVDAAALRQQRSGLLEAFARSDSYETRRAEDAYAGAVCAAGKIIAPEQPIFNLAPGASGVLFSGDTVDLDAAVPLPGEVRVIACVSRVARELRTCPYSDGRSVVLRQWVYTLRYFDLAAATSGVKEFEGSAPQNCPFMVEFLIGQFRKEVNGSSPSPEEMAAWVRGQLR